MSRHKPPSQIRYEKSHPTISFRLDLDTKERLKKILEKKSFADFVKEGLGKREREKASIEYERKKGYIEGYKEGYDRGSRDQSFYTYCAICDRKILLGTEKEKEEIDMYFRRIEWSHARCIEEAEKRRMRDHY